MALLKRNPKERELVKSILIREAKHNPYLGVRKLAALLKTRYKITISKSAVNNILLKLKGRVKKGRKHETLSYQSRQEEDCAPLILRAFDSQLGLFDAAAKCLWAYMPQIKEVNLKRALTAVALAEFFKKPLRRGADIREILRASDLYAFPSRQARALCKAAERFKPTVNFKPLLEDLKLCSTVKISFQNGAASFCDGGLSTLWDRPCYVEQFFSPLSRARKRLRAMIDNNLIIINYTKSFDYISPLVLTFIRGVSGGIKKVEFLSPRGEVLESMNLEGIALNFLVGYYPKGLSKGIHFLRTEKRFKKIEYVTGDIYYLSALTQFFLPKDPKGVILNSILLRRNTRFLPCWGIFTNKKSDTTFFVNKYLNLWPHMEVTFSEDMTTMEKFYTTHYKAPVFGEFLPASVEFAHGGDFARLPELLKEAFTRTLGALDFSNLRGYIIITKKAVKLVVKKIPPELKERFNRGAFYLNNRRVFLI